jgi:hypothetical protein
MICENGSVCNNGVFTGCTVNKCVCNSGQAYYTDDKGEATCVGKHAQQTSVYTVVLHLLLTYHSWLCAHIERLRLAWHARLQLQSCAV